MAPCRFFVGGNFKIYPSVLGSPDPGYMAKLDDKTEVVIAPPALYLLLYREHLNKEIEVAAQNVFDKLNGAFTGEISASQLQDSGITWVIQGHSERRVILGEDDKVALDTGLGVILYYGESLEQRESKIIVTYEPIWAISTAKVATSEQAQEVHAAIRKWLAEKVFQKAADETRIIYGGSVHDKNCGELATQCDIDGFLVGGASLGAAFCDIVSANSKL